MPTGTLLLLLLLLVLALALELDEPRGAELLVITDDCVDETPLGEVFVF
jgi:hypothetical protein